MRSSHELALIVSQTKVGKKVDVEVVRDGKTVVKTIKVGTRKEKEEEGEEVTSKAPEELGFEVQELTPELAKRLGLKVKEGILVVEVDRSSPAYEAGLRKNDVIVEVNRKKVTSIEAFEDALSEKSEGGYLFLVRRGEGALYIVVQPEKDEEK